MAIVVAVSWACAGKPEPARPTVAVGPGAATTAPTSPATAPATGAPMMSAAMPAGNLYGTDVSALRHLGPDDAVLVRMKGRPFIRARDYNDWLGSYPLNITSQDPAEGFRQALEQMAMFRMMLSHAKKAGYEAKVRTTGGVPDERSIVLLFIRDQITNISTVSDAAARDYEATHPERFPQGDGRLPPEILAMAVKGEIRGQQFTEEIKGWMKQEGVTFASVRTPSSPPT